ncbi:thiamine phosphate synthase [Arcanobacterium bovis]|uniref:Thiamine-phosphate synthase n=1 Tax=Arcanobacterium bovis TaxID=2529275 RepID=A0A4Q9V061_9ACTO|nr:thiamine phosphate synthase [Arcanobacterium bovis]TBW22043.1 thiamine phosphate synthase [Arcanobacterium bovis]
MQPRIPSGIYYVTDPELTVQSSHPSSGFPVARNPAVMVEYTARLCSDVVAAGVEIVQLRWKNCPAQHLLDLAQAVRQRVGPACTLIINDRIDVFLAARTLGIPIDGVHVGQHDLDPRTVRTLVGARAILGVSASTPEELNACTALQAIIDYVGVGVLHPSSTKLDAPPPLGIEKIANISASMPLPVVVIGGITSADIPDLARSRIHNAAVVSEITTALDPYRMAHAMCLQWNENRG